MKNPDSIKEHIAFILNTRKTIGECKPHIDNLLDLFSRITGISVKDDLNSRQDTYLSSGVAISPIEAAKCGQEIARSRIFLQGIHQAIEDQLAEKESIHILYAGTGPYGFILTPLLHLFDSTRVKVTFLEVNQPSLDALKHLIDALDLNSYVDGFLLDDATQWNADNKQFDLIISETMKAMLRREPQVAVFAHLSNYLTLDGKLIPESINLNAWLADINREQQQRFEGKSINDYTATALGNFFSLNQSTAKELARGNSNCLKGIIDIPCYNTENLTLKMTTDICVYKNHCINEWQSDLTIPLWFHNQNPKPGSQVQFNYQAGTNPVFIFTIDGLEQTLNLPDADEVGHSNIPRIKRLWKKCQLDRNGNLNNQIRQQEWAEDNAFMDNIGLPLSDWLSTAYQSPTFEVFEDWVVSNKQP